MNERIKLAGYHFVSRIDDEGSHIRIIGIPDKELNNVIKQILDDYTIITEFDKGAWKDVIEYIRDAKVKRGKLIGENILLHDKLAKIEYEVQRVIENVHVPMVNESCERTIKELYNTLQSILTGDKK